MNNLTAVEQCNLAAQWWVGREVICEPVTGQVWHRVMAAKCFGVYGPTVLVLEGGNELNLCRIDANIRQRQP